jgi:peptidoglycan hydrolase-like protein with peptidoglycan-binding domain
MISNSGHDENGKYTGGKAGDQTGKEWALQKWYDRPWKCVLRHPDAEVRELLAELAEKAAKNDNVGYNQNKRGTYWIQLEAAGYDPSKITTPCDGDCSGGVMANVKAAGYLLQRKELQEVTITTTSYMRKVLKKAGFEVLEDSKYLTSDKYLLRGDILLNDGKHTATNVTDGECIDVQAFDFSVKDFQTWLNTTYKTQLKKNLGALLDVDGKYGTKSRAAALCAWKYELNKKKTGYTFDLTDSTFDSNCSKYASKAAVKRGTSGNFVYIMQGILRVKGYYTGALDGKAGALSDTAIRNYQKAEGLDVDGSCGPKTWKSLFS